MHSGVLVLCRSSVSVMIRAQKLPEILGSVLHDGILGAVLMTTEGSVICSLFKEEAVVNETSWAAVSSSMWVNYSQNSGLQGKENQSVHAGSLQR